MPNDGSMTDGVYASTCCVTLLASHTSSSAGIVNSRPSIATAHEPPALALASSALSCSVESCVRCSVTSLASFLNCLPSAASDFFETA